MTARYRQMMFTPQVIAAQQRINGRGLTDGGPQDLQQDRLGPDEQAFLSDRDSFHVATVSAGGWPYIQHRGGPKGFVRILSDQRFAFPDFRGNRQYISVGNLTGDDRAAFFFLDHVNRARLKLMGRIRIVTAEDDPALIAGLAVEDYPGRIERALVVTVEAFEWNCPQHIEPRYTLAELSPTLEVMKARIRDLETELELARAKA
jgi:uncharacterized protein